MKTSKIFTLYFKTNKDKLLIISDVKTAFEAKVIFKVCCFK